MIKSLSYGNFRHQAEGFLGPMCFSSLRHATKLLFCDLECWGNHIPTMFKKWKSEVGQDSSVRWYFLFVCLFCLHILACQSDYRENQYPRISNFVVFGGILLESRCWQWGPYLKHNISEFFSHLWERWWNGCHACRRNNVTMTEGLVLRAREADIYLTTFCRKAQDRPDKSRVRFQWRDLCLSPCTAQGQYLRMFPRCVR